MFTINPDMCIECGTCKENCPADAIVLWFDIDRASEYCKIIESKCMQCGTCQDICPTGAVENVTK